MASELDVLAREQGDALVRFAYLLTGDRDDAQDLVQSVLVRLSRRGVDDIDDLGSYARRALVNLHRTQGRRAVLHIRSMNRIAASAETRQAAACEPTEADQLKDVVARGLQALPARQRAVVLLRYYEDRADDEIADLLGCAPATVRSLLARARRALRHELDPFAGSRTPGDVT